MDLFYWVMIGILVAFVAKVQFTTDSDENLLALLAAGVAGAVIGGLCLQVIGRSGPLAMSWVSHVAAFVGAAVLVLGMRLATHKHLA